MTHIRSSLATLAACSSLSSIAFAQTAPPGAPPAAAPAPGTTSAVESTAPSTVPSTVPSTAPPAGAAQPPPEQAIFVAQPPLPPLEPRWRHYHDGFYLRMSLGFGALGVSSSTDHFGSFTASGSGAALDLMIGGTPAPGLVIGGGILWQEAFNPNYSVSTAGAPTSSTIPFVMVGPMIDAFPNPSGGFHFGGLLGFSRVGVKDTNDNPSSGLGISAWAGYMWWASSDWSLGGLIRLSGAWSGRTLGQGATQFDATDTTRSITFMFSTLYH